jgi:uncharacterized OsmC-like protein
VHWSIHAELSRGGAFAFDLAPDGSGRQARPPSEAVPVEQLLVSVASCFARSCHIVLEARGEAPCDIRIDLTGEKAGDPPNRLERIRLACELVGLDAGLAGRIRRDAKRICTVTNTLACAFEVAE